MDVDRGRAGERGGRSRGEGNKMEEEKREEGGVGYILSCVQDEKLYDSYDQ